MTLTMEKYYPTPEEVRLVQDDYAERQKKREEASQKLTEKGSPIDLFMSFIKQYLLEKAGKKLAETEARADALEFLKKMELSNEHQRLRKNLADASEALKAFEQEKLGIQVKEEKDNK